MQELSGLKLKGGGAADRGGAGAVAAPPPIPAGMHTAPMPAPSADRPAPSAHPDGFPPERDIGPVGKGIVWSLALLIFGGGLAGWFLLFGVAGQFVASNPAFGRLAELRDRAGNISPLVGTSLGAADKDDLEFLSQKLGIEREKLGLSAESGATGAVPDAEAKAVLPADWPEISVTGIMKSSAHAGARVILNGVMVREGETYRGVEVAEVKDTSVALRYQDQLRWMNSGETTTE